MDMETHVSPAVWYARILGVVLTIVGILGFFVNTSQDVAKQLLGFDVNLLHNFVHLGTGILGLVAGFAVLTAARSYAWVFGIVYTVVGIWGLSDSNPMGIFVHINDADNLLHLALGIIGIVAAAVSMRDTDRVTTRGL
jgi:hypothetical protein